MQKSTLMITVLSAWAMAIVYYRIDMNTGIEVGPLLYSAIITLGLGICLACRNNKESDKEEA